MLGRVLSEFMCLLVVALLLFSQFTSVCFVGNLLCCADRGFFSVVLEDSGLVVIGF